MAAYTLRRNARLAFFPGTGADDGEAAAPLTDAAAPTSGALPFCGHAFVEIATTIAPTHNPNAATFLIECLSCWQ
jgi:hypothetical protein